jgi:putative LysE/RhtB family amino acid efflux pump
VERVGATSRPTGTRLHGCGPLRTLFAPWQRPVSSRKPGADLSALLSGFGLGFGVAAGFGPINVLCLTTGLQSGFLPAFGIGVGAAIVDGFYALLAGLGAAALLTGDARGWLQIVGGTALVVVGIRIARSARAAAEAPTTTRSFGSALRISLAATLANPPTIVSWAAAFAGVVPALDLSRAETLTLLPPAVAAGTLAWFTLVAGAAAYARRLARESVLRVVSLVGGVVIAALGVVLAVDGIRGL